MRRGRFDWLWLPLVVAVLGIAVTAWVHRVLLVLDEAHVQERVDVQASLKAAELRGRLKSIGLDLVRMGRRWETRGTPPRYEWEADALQYAAPDSTLKAIEWASRREIIRWVVPSAGNEADLDLPLARHPVRHEAVLRAAGGRAPVMSRAWCEGDECLAALCVPLRINGESDGTIIGLIRVASLLNDVLGRGQDPDFTYRVENAGLMLRTTTDPILRFTRSERVIVHGGEWRLSVYPTRDLIAAARSGVPTIVLVLGLFSSLLLAAAAGFARTARTRLTLLERSHAALVREIADRKRAENEILRLNAGLEQRVEERTAELSRSNEELQRFAYVASHDLQEPLRAISSFTQLLARRYRGRLGPDADEFIQFAVDGCTRVQALINALLAYSRVDTRALPFTRVRLEDALGAAAANLRIAVEESGARITHDPLPEVQGDEAQLTQLFQNLVGNAIKFRGADAPEVRISAEERHGEWIVSVADNGIGLEPRFGERIFVMFQRLHPRDEYPGTGIGLAICKKIVERHGGRIWVESTPGQGAVFRFILQAATVGAAEELLSRA